MQLQTVFLLTCFISPLVFAENPPVTEEKVSTVEEEKGALDRMLDASNEMLGASKDLVTGWLGTEEKDKFPIVWEKAYPTLDDLLKLKEKHEDLPDSAWFGSDKKSNQEKIDELLRAAVEILGISRIQENLLEIRELEKNLEATHKEIGEWQAKKIGRPNKVEKYDSKIVTLKEKAVSYEEKIAEKKAEIVQDMQASGVQLSSEQLNVLMSSVIGDDVVEMSVVFDNVKRLSNQLADLMTQNGENLEFARKHYGMYAILLEVVITMQEDFVGDVLHKYLPAIEKISKNTQKLQKRTRLLLDAETDPVRHADLASSWSAQQLTLDTIKLYQKRLKDQSNQVLEAKTKLEKDLDVALIRYQTVKLSNELVSMIQASNNQFQALANLQLPSLTPFENLAMKTEYEKLTEALRQAEIE